MNCISKSLIQAKKIYPFCVASALNGKLLTYKELRINQFPGYKKCARGGAITSGLELVLIACGYRDLPRLTAIVVEQKTQKPAPGGYPFPESEWLGDVEKIFNYQKWLSVDDIDWNYVWKNRVELSNSYGTKDFWKRKKPTR